MSDPVKKIIVAVHGIGDQTRKETVLAVLKRFCARYDFPAVVPLGAFYIKNNSPFVLKGSPPRAGLVGEIGFAEVYWADVPRKVVDRGYTLQETKAWARTIVERVGVLAQEHRSNPLTRKIDYKQIGEVLEDLITGIQVLETLTFLAKKAGVVDFNLKKLLEDYLGDVQVVTEFTCLRDKIVGRFTEIMEIVYDSHQEAEIYIVAHSEGTVISWLGLLEAMSAVKTPPWLPLVRGFMTFGSPIDKHLILWPQLFSGFKSPQRLCPKPEEVIKWRNYTDYGDPIGFELDTARSWMIEHGYNNYFDFTEKDDYDLFFSRYYVPGKAHNDYWDDNEVFGHFIDSVVASPPKRNARTPVSNIFAQLCSYVVAYLIPLLLVYAAVYLLYKNLGEYLPTHTSHILKNVALLGGLLAGFTVFWRLLNLARSLKWLILGPAIFLITLGLFLYCIIATPEVQWFNPFAKVSSGLSSIFSFCFLIMFALPLAWRISSLIKTSPQFPDPRKSRGLSKVKLFVLIMGAILILKAASDWMVHRADRQSLWPLLVSIVAAVYLWWLSIMLFDLVFVWHRYIRHGLGLSYIRDAFRETDRSTEEEPGKPANS